MPITTLEEKENISQFYTCYLRLREVRPSHLGSTTPQSYCYSILVISVVSDFFFERFPHLLGDCVLN